jgi:hypothetical protein
MTTKTDLTEHVPTDIINKYTAKFRNDLMSCVNCPIVLECPLTKDKIRELNTKAEEVAKLVYDEEIELDDSTDNQLRAEEKRNKIYKEYIRNNAYQKLEQQKCYFEVEEVKTIIKKFLDSGYDPSDPRVHIILQEIISSSLLSGRINKVFTGYGLLLKKDSPAGEIFYENPMLKHKIFLTKVMIEAIETLDRILKSDATTSYDMSFTNHIIDVLGKNRFGTDNNE